MIPVFSEWTAQQQIQEAEKKLVELTNSTEPNKEIKNETLAKHQIVKMRQKNYASPDCGAKVLASNPEAQSTSSVLTDKDEYLLSPCTDKVWFVVELCDSIQAQRVELANFELFSSPLKSMTISVSNRFPAREWMPAGQYEAKSERDVQVLELTSTLFGKFVRVDLTYTNTEHYCPLSFFRVFGTSEIEAFEVENEPPSEMNSIDNDDEIELSKVQQPNKDNLLNRAGAAVMSIVHKAAEVLAKSNDNGSKQNVTSIKAYQQNCVSLSHNILCQPCSTDERNELDDLISCKSLMLLSLLKSDAVIRDHLVNSVACHNILGFGLKTQQLETSKSFIISILPKKYIAAMCNLVATDQKALPFRIEDIHQNLISKKDEVSLKNVSKKETPLEEDPQCKQDFYTPSELDSQVNLTTSEEASVQETVQEDATSEQKNISLTGDELNIFNVVEQTNEQETSSTDLREGHDLRDKKVDETEESKEIVDKKDGESPITNDSPREAPLESAETTEAPTEMKMPQPETKIVQKEVKVSVPESKVQQSDFKIENAEVKINGDFRSSNPPESVFLRLSNRIKTLEKNMTLSTQYLEELSRRYKKQIEELQQSFSKLQTSVETQSYKQSENSRREGEEKRRLRENVSELNQKSEYMEVILIVLSAFLTVETILVIALFKRLSVLRRQVSTILHQESSPNTPTTTNANSNDKSRSRKRSKQRTRKISAPNILTQRSPVKNEFTQIAPALSRTVSAPKFNTSVSITENKENFDDMQAMLEENDDILIPGFDELRINDNVSVKSKDLDSASTASAMSSNEKHKSNSNKSFKFKRRLSSPFQLKKLELKKSNADRTNQGWATKALSESPPRINETFKELQKSNSFHEDGETMKFKKSNSFKKLFKKIF